MERGALSSLLISSWSAIRFLLATAGWIITWSVSLVLKVAIANQGINTTCQSAQPLSALGGDLKIWATENKKRSKRWHRSRVKKNAQIQGACKEKRSRDGWPGQTDPPAKRSRVCKSQGWKFIIHSPGELMGEEWDLPPFVGRNLTSKKLVRNKLASMEFRSQNGAKSIETQMWNFNLPSSGEVDGEEMVQCLAPVPKMVTAETGELLKPGFRSRVGAKSGETNVRHSPVGGMVGSWTVNGVWSVLGRRCLAGNLPSGRGTLTVSPESRSSRSGDKAPNCRPSVNRVGRFTQIGYNKRSNRLLLQAGLSRQLTTRNPLGYLIPSPLSLISLGYQLLDIRKKRRSHDSQHGRRKTTGEHHGPSY